MSVKKIVDWAVRNGDVNPSILTSLLNELSDEVRRPVITTDFTFTEQDLSDLDTILGISDVDAVQQNLVLANGAISGKVFYQESVNTFDMTKGHYFIILHFTAADADKLEASMDPTQGQLVECDESGVMVLQMKDDHSQSIRVVATNEFGANDERILIDDLEFVEANDNEEIG